MFRKKVMAIAVSIFLILGFFNVISVCAAENLIPNGDFESTKIYYNETLGWVANKSAAAANFTAGYTDEDAHSGTYSYKVAINSTDTVAKYVWLSRSINITGGSTYRFSVWIKGDMIMGRGFRPMIYSSHVSSDQTVAVYPSVGYNKTTNGNWEKFQFDFNAPGTSEENVTITIRLRVDIEGAKNSTDEPPALIPVTGEVYFDDASLIILDNNVSDFGYYREKDKAVGGVYATANSGMIGVDEIYPDTNIYAVLRADTSMPQNATMLIGIYDGDKLKSIKLVDISGERTAAQRYTNTINITQNELDAAPNGLTVKTFVWNGLGYIQPLRNVEFLYAPEE